MIGIAFLVEFFFYLVAFLVEFFFTWSSSFFSCFLTFLLSFISSHLCTRSWPYRSILWESVGIQENLWLGIQRLLDVQDAEIKYRFLTEEIKKNNMQSKKGVKSFLRRKKVTILLLWVTSLRSIMSVCLSYSSKGAGSYTFMLLSENLFITKRDPMIYRTTCIR